VQALAWRGQRAAVDVRVLHGDAQVAHPAPLRQRAESSGRAGEVLAHDDHAEPRRGGGERRHHAGDRGFAAAGIEHDDIGTGLSHEPRDVGGVGRRHRGSAHRADLADDARGALLEACVSGDHEGVDQRGARCRSRGLRDGARGLHDGIVHAVADVMRDVRPKSNRLDEA
jgi:hypothetical protein